MLFNEKVNAASNNGATKLHKAVQQGSLALVTSLLEQKADPNRSDINNETPLFTCVLKGNVEILRKLLEANADPEIKM